jgi:hypothetical protein
MAVISEHLILCHTVIVTRPPESNTVTMTIDQGIKGLRNQIALHCYCVTS